MPSPRPGLSHPLEISARLVLLTRQLFTAIDTPFHRYEFKELTASERLTAHGRGGAQGKAMCGRFVLYSPLNQLMALFGIEAIACEATASYNIAPTREVVAVIQRPERRMGLLRWGFVPSWAKEPPKGRPMINARLETIARKPAFRAAFSRKRCLIPADGFYEWQKEGKEKKPWYFTLEGESPMALAGVYETWHPPEGHALHTCAIVTTEAFGAMRPIHHRMPLIIAPSAVDAWLDPSLRDPERIMAEAAKAQVKTLFRRRVSPLVGKASFDGPACIAPFTDPPAPPGELFR